jgi:hypothetical protein
MGLNSGLIPRNDDKVVEQSATMLSRMFPEKWQRRDRVRVGSSFSGTFARVEIGHIVIGSESRWWG